MEYVKFEIPSLKASLIFILWISSLGCQVESAVSTVRVDSMHIFTKIRYRYSHTKVLCQMHNSGSKAQEASFKMILPDAAFVSMFIMEIDGQKYRSSIQEVVEAKKTYSKALRNGNTAGIINEEKNMFNISINLEANKTVLFNLEYEEEIILTTGVDAHYEYSVSFVPQEMKINHLCIDIDVIEFKNFTISALNLCNRYCVDINVEKEAFILQRDRGKRIIWEPTAVPGKMEELQEKGALGKFKITYEFSEPDTLNEVLIHDGYFLYRFSPRGLQTIPLHVIFVLDTSESMIDHRMVQLTEAMMTILDDLKPHDYFSIVTFSSTSKIWSLFPEVDHNNELTTFPANPINVHLAKRLVRQLRYHGSTNIYAALMDALEIAKYPSPKFKNYLNESNVNQDDHYVKPTPIIFFLTDGRPTSGRLVEPLEIVQKVHESNTIFVPIFSLAFGLTADYPLLYNLSLPNNGVARRIFDNAEASDMLKNFYTFVASPVLTNLTFCYTSQLTDLSSEREPWLPQKGEFSISGKIESSHLNNIHLNPFNATISGDRNGERIFYKYVCNKTSKPGPYYLIDRIDEIKSLDACGRGRVGGDEDLENSFLERLWAYKMLKKLIVQAKAGNRTIHENILTLAKKYHFVTPFTSLLVIIPFDKETRSNRREIPYSGDIASQILRDSNKRNFSIVERTNPQSSNPIKNWYAFSISNAKNESIHRESLQEYMERLVSEQTEQRRKNSVEKKLELDDIKWLNSSKEYKLNLINRDKRIHPFEVLKRLESPQQTFPSCRIGKVLVGKCTHLVNCIQSSFLKDIELFVKSYFCPLIGEDGSFVGSCCPGSTEESPSRV